jgi:GNAT superfamily N-acetyltransferase
MEAELKRALSKAGAALRFDQRPGDIGEIIRLHGLLYSSEHGYGLDFEGYVAKTFAGYAWPLSMRERLWLVEKSGELCGSTAIVKTSPTCAQLRWLLLRADLRGHGLGRALVSDALAFCRESGYRSVMLWTEGSLSAATTLYRSFGFERTEARTSVIWGSERTEERYDLPLS